MKQQMTTFSVMALMVTMMCLQPQAWGAEPPPGDVPVESDAASTSSVSATGTDISEERARRDERRARRDANNDRVAIGSNADLPAGEFSDSVVAIGGDANVAGDVKDAVVAIMGNTMVDGNVGESVVTIFGNSYVNSRVGEDVVTILGNVELGPRAVIEGELVNIGGTVKRDPAAIVNRMQSIKPLPFSVDFDWFKSWVKECLFYGRLLAFQPGLLWAWGVALVSLLLYVLGAALVPQTVEKCVNTLETWPGRSLLAALLSIPLIPVLMLLLVITVIGLLAVPVVGIALLTASWFGKLIMLGWIGKRLMQAFKMEQMHWALAVLLGGVVATLLYTIPVIGLLSYKLLQFIGFGAVLYTMLMMFRKPALQTGTGDALPSDGAALATAGIRDDGNEASFNTTQTGATPAADASEHALSAGLWPRMGALAIDVISVGIIGGVLDVVDVGGRGFLLLLATYGALMWKLKGTTIGGIVFHLQVVRSDGRNMDWSTSIVRALSCFLSLAALGMGFIWIAIDPARQAWHDKIAGTMVVRMAKGKSLV